MRKRIIKRQSGSPKHQGAGRLFGSFLPISTRRLSVAGTAALLAASSLGNPVGMTVSRGSATATQRGSSLNVRVSNGALLNWKSFNIGRGETTTFIQPSSTSVVWNRINSPNLSQIWGTLNGNGWVVLMNQNGFYFGPNSVVNVHGLMVTTSPIAQDSPMNGGLWQYTGNPPLASIVNYGEIHAQGGGSTFLISERIENHGKISAPGGTVGLYAGKEVLVSERPDGRGLSAAVKLPAGSVDNKGNLIADAGTIAMHAKVVNQNGLVQADSVREHNGVIELVASESVNLGPHSVLQANGGTTGISPGGNITIKAGQTFNDADGSKIDVRGGAQGGNGGAVEISAAQMGSIHSRIDGSAQGGWKGGELLLDPTDIILSTDGNGSAGSGTVLAGDNPDTLNLNVNSAFLGFSAIRLEAMRDIILSPFTFWNLNGSTGLSDPGSLLTLEAGRNIVFGDNSQISGGPGWSMRLAAGVDFSSPTHSVRNGIGSIYFNGGAADANGSRPSGNGALQTAEGSISLEAGHEILVGSGFIRTVIGGNISITTGDGDVDAGINGNWYKFSSTRTGAGYDIDPQGLGGIGTEYGGNVSINSGHDILSFAPYVGAFGAGDVTLRAANNILGRFLLRNGRGTIDVAGDAGSGDSPISLALIQGGWDVHGRNVFINEVFNPNGSLNNSLVGAGPVGVTRLRFRFDYAPDAFVHLNGDNAVQLLGNNPAHVNDNADRLPIYPPQLTISAGQGGITLGNDVILFPSSQGLLRINDAGSLASTAGRFVQLVMADSATTDYKAFATGHSSTPLHLGDTDPLSIVVGGDLENMFIRSPKLADINVGGKALNFTFEGQNLSPNNVSRIRIAGDYTSRSDRTPVIVGDPAGPQDNTFDRIFNHPLFPVEIANPDLAARLSYNPTTHTLILQGRMTQQDLDFLLHPKVVDVNEKTQVVNVGPDGLPILKPVSVTPEWSAAIQALNLASQDIPSSSLAFSGIQIGGPGALAISARSMDLGISQGIRSVGTFLNSSVQSVLYPGGNALPGATVSLDLGGDLNMIASQIASFNGGNISVQATHGGSLNIGSQEQFTSDDTPKGIYTAHGGDVFIRSDGNINVNGSRIATYDGGDLSVNSIGGTVDAGGGARGFFTVATQQINKQGGLEVRNDRFFGSGILALTRPDSDSKVGNISVSAGVDIVAASAGVLQLAFNITDKDHLGILNLTAGRDIDTPSGVLGDIITEKAGRFIKGIIVAQGPTPPVLATGPQGAPPAPGQVQGPQVAAPPPPPPPAPPPPPQAPDEQKAVAKAKDEETDEQKKNREKTAPVLAKTVGRVTVILPPQK